MTPAEQGAAIERKRRRRCKSRLRRIIGCYCQPLLRAQAPCAASVAAVAPVVTAVIPAVVPLVAALVIPAVVSLVAALLIALLAAAVVLLRGLAPALRTPVAAGFLFVVAPAKLLLPLVARVALAVLAVVVVLAVPAAFIAVLLEPFALLLVLDALKDAAENAAVIGSLAHGRKDRGSSRSGNERSSVQHGNLLSSHKRSESRSPGERGNEPQCPSRPGASLEIII